MDSNTLYIPEGIRFGCSGCGNCCLHWPVPVSESDVNRIEATSLAPQFRALKSGDLRLRGFTHTLEKRGDGRCQFLTDENRCSLHTEYGSESKPSMCQLFPHSFTLTPSGTFAYMSFASSAVLSNSGPLLSDQQGLLQEKLQLYKKLFPAAQPDWSHLQLIDGIPLSWDEYMSIEETLLDTWRHSCESSPTAKLRELSKAAVQLLPNSAFTEKLPPLPTAPAVVDQLILKYLALSYLPQNVFHEDGFDLHVEKLMAEIAAAPNQVSLIANETKQTSFQKLADLSLNQVSEEEAQLDELLNRFVYSRIFAKLYFGPNLAHLSLIAGLHHLFFVVALIRLQVKQSSLAGKPVSFQTAAEVLRTVERRLTQMNFSRASSAVMEALFSNPERLERVYELAR